MTAIVLSSLRKDAWTRANFRCEILMKFCYIYEVFR